MKRRIAVLMGAGLGAVGLTAAQVHTDSPQSRRVKVEWSAESTAPSIGAIQCDAAGRCIATYTLESTYVGDLEAVSSTTGTLMVDQQSGVSEGSSYNLITGTIAGCGTGSFIVRLPSFESHPPDPVVADGDIVAGSGTGDLVGLSGRYSATFTTLADGSGVSTGNLKVRCSHSSR